MPKPKVSYGSTPVPVLQPSTAFELGNVLGDAAKDIPLPGETQDEALVGAEESASDKPQSVMTLVKTVPTLEESEEEKAVQPTPKKKSSFTKKKVEPKTAPKEEQVEIEAVNSPRIDMAQFLTQLKTPAVYRSKGYASHMCSVGADDALKELEKLFRDKCGLPKPVQDRYLWNLGIIFLHYALRDLAEANDPCIDRIKAAGSSEDLVLYELIDSLMAGIRK